MKKRKTAITNKRDMGKKNKKSATGHGEDMVKVKTMMDTNGEIKNDAMNDDGVKAVQAWKKKGKRDKTMAGEGDQQGRTCPAGSKTP